jgi:hypothetical protein
MPRSPKKGSAPPPTESDLRKLDRREKLKARGWKVLDEEQTTVAFVGEAEPEAPEDEPEDS